MSVRFKKLVIMLFIVYCDGVKINHPKLIKNLFILNNMYFLILRRAFDLFYRLKKKCR